MPNSLSTPRKPHTEKPPEATAPETKASPPTRALRGKMRTRAKLIEAAMHVMGRKGVEGATINEITEAADVGFGSFYNHFNSKEELAQAVFEVLNEELAVRLDAISSEAVDVAQGVAYVQLAIIRKAVTEPVWGWFLVNANSALKVMEGTYHERAKLDFVRGEAQGRFSIPNHDVAATITLTALMGFVKSTLEGVVKPSDAHDLVEMMLRSYGLSLKDARQVARARVPKAYQL